MKADRTITKSPLEKNNIPIRQASRHTALQSNKSSMNYVRSLWRNIRSAWFLVNVCLLLFDVFVNDTTATECNYIYKLAVYALLLFFSCV